MFSAASDKRSDPRQAVTSAAQQQATRPADSLDRRSHSCCTVNHQQSGVRTGGEGGGGTLVLTTLPALANENIRTALCRAETQLGATFSLKQTILWVLIVTQIKKGVISKHVVLKTNVPFQPFTSEFILVLLQVRARLEPVRLEPLSLFLFVLFGPLLLVLAIVELLVGADGGLDMWHLGARSGEGPELRPLRLGGRGRPAAVVLRAQATRTLPDVVAGFVEIQLDLCNSVSMAGRAPRLAGAVSSVRG